MLERTHVYILTPQQLEIGQFTILMLDLQFPQKEESVQSVLTGMVAVQSQVHKSLRWLHKIYDLLTSNSILISGRTNVHLLEHYAPSPLHHLSKTGSKQLCALVFTPRMYQQSCYFLVQCPG